MVLADDVIGHVVNIAARVTELAKGGQVTLTGDASARRWGAICPRCDVPRG